MRRPGAERAGEHRGRDRAGQRRGEAGHASPAEAEKARRAVMNTIEKESLDKTGLRSDVVTLYQAGCITSTATRSTPTCGWSSRPEQDIAFFGGDPDNFEYPRYDLDICFFRVYENGKPAKIDALPEVEPGRAQATASWCSSPAIPADRPAEHGAPPGVPPRRACCRSRWTCSGGARCCCGSSASGAPRTPAGPRTSCSAYQNSRKARLGGLAGLQDPAVMDRKRAEEKALRAGRRQGPEAASDVRRRLGRRRQVARDLDRRSTTTIDLLERGTAFNSASCSRSPAGWCGWPRRPPSPTPSGCASTASRTSTRSSRSCSPRRRSTTTWRPSKLADSLSMYRGDGRRPTIRWCRRCWPASRRSERAAELVARHASWPTWPCASSWPRAACKAIEASDDPMIRLARLVDPAGPRGPQDLRGAGRGAAAAGLRARSPTPASRCYGTETYPDATFTLRLAFGAGEGLHARTASRFRPGRRSAARIEHAEEHGNQRAVRPARKLARAQGPARTWTRRSTSSARPTSSAATRAARWSTATASWSASSSTATSSRWCSISSTPTQGPRRERAQQRHPRGAAEGVRCEGPGG